MFFGDKIKEKFKKTSLTTHLEEIVLKESFLLQHVGLMDNDNNINDNDNNDNDNDNNNNDNDNNDNDNVKNDSTHY